MNDEFINILAEKIAQTKKTFETLKATLETSYAIIDQKNELLVNQIKKLTMAISDNNGHATELSEKMSSALKDLIESQKKLEEDIKKIYT
jgi:flagellar biosynthesis chaperone FliJ